MQHGGELNVRTKSSHADLVTAADTACEDLLRKALAPLVPGAAFWGEESNASSGRPTQSAYWLVDPIDGTVNYAHDLAYWAVNIALVQDDETVLAVTLQNPHRRVYWAETGKGAWLREPGQRERRLQVSSATRLEQAFLATGFPYHVAKLSDNNEREFLYFSTRCLGMRVLGAGALDIAQVAAGMLAGFWEGWLEPWDAVAGTLLVAESGGLATDYAGEPWRPGSPGFVSSNGHIHEALLDGIRLARSGMSDSVLAL
jgi:myo-inositol-1(or 4)-monophosphatase